MFNPNSFERQTAVPIFTNTVDIVDSEKQVRRVNLNEIKTVFLEANLGFVNPVLHLTYSGKVDR